MNHSSPTAPPDALALLAEHYDQMDDECRERAERTAEAIENNEPYRYKGK